MRKLRASVRKLAAPGWQQCVGIGCVAAGIAQWSVGAALVAVGVVVTALGVSREAKAGVKDAR